MTNAAVVHEIVLCAQSQAESEGVSATLVNVTPNKDAFAVQLWRKTSGDPDWTLKQFSTQPYDADFSCTDDWQKASNDNPLPLHQQSQTIVCSKNPGKHLILAVQTSAGKVNTFELDSVDEEIKKMREDMESRLNGIEEQLNGMDAKLTQLQTSGVPSAIAAAVAPVRALINEFTKAFAPMGGACPTGMHAVSTVFLPTVTEANSKMGPFTAGGVLPGGSWVMNTQVCSR